MFLYWTANLQLLIKNLIEQKKNKDNLSLITKGAVF